MTKISYYEVYTDGGDGWKLVQKYAQEDRSKAFNLAKDKERENFAVKVIREVFDSSDGSFSESVEYVKGLRHGKKPSFYSSKHIKEHTQGKLIKEKLSVPTTSKAVFILFAIVIISGVVVNILGTLAFPLFEMFLAPESVRGAYFITLFVLFISIAFPLMIKKVPWQDLSITSFNKHYASEETFVIKAKSVVERYQINEDFADDKTPTFPSSKPADKKAIINFMAQILSSIPTDSLSGFNKLGMKLVIYGAVLEYCHYKRLKSGDLNSLLSEAITILDGTEDDLVLFYQAKKSYKNQKQALYLTGLGAFLMDRFILKNPVDKDLLTNGLKKWQELKSATPEDLRSYDMKIAKIHQSVLVPNIVTINYNIKLFENQKPNAQKKQISAIEDIAKKLAKKLEGRAYIQSKNHISLEFFDLSIGIAFAKQVLAEIDDYVYQLNDENIIFNIKTNIIKKQDNNDNASYIQDILEYANDDEILTTINIINEARAQTNLEFSSIGKKVLPRVAKNVELFKIV